MPFVARSSVRRPVTLGRFIIKLGRFIFKDPDGRCSYMKPAEREIEYETFITWCVGVLMPEGRGVCEAMPSHTATIRHPSGNIVGLYDLTVHLSDYNGHPYPERHRPSWSVWG